MIDIICNVLNLLLFYAAPRFAKSTLYQTSRGVGGGWTSHNVYYDRYQGLIV